MGKQYLASVARAFGIALSLGIVGCGGGGSDSNPAPTSTVAPAPTSTVPVTATVTAAPTSTAPVTATVAVVPTSTPTATATITPGGPLTVAEAVVRDSNGVAIRLNQTVTTEGFVTVSAGLFANNKLKIFLQSEGAGIEVYNQTAANVPPGDFEATQRCRVTGVVRQADPAGENVLTGTVMVDVSAGSWVILSSDNPLPDPQTITLHDLEANGIPFVGVLVQVAHVQKVSGDWPALGDKTTSVMISDDGAITELPLRFQRNTITAELVNKLNAIGDGPFNVVGIAVQNAVDGNLLGNFEIWVRGAEDIIT